LALAVSLAGACGVVPAAGEDAEQSVAGRPDEGSPLVSDLVVEIHVPLLPAPNTAEGEYQYPWIDTVMEYLLDLDGERGEMYDDGEEDGDEYLFFVSGAPEDDLLALAREVAALHDVPAGVYAMVTDTDAAEFGTGRRVDLADQ